MRGRTDLDLRIVLVTVLCAIGTVGCEGDPGVPVAGTSDDLPEVAGVWTDNYGGWTAIDESQWGASQLHAFDNTANRAITQNPPNDPWSPDLFNVVVWTEPEADGSWWMCTVAFDLDTFDAAQATEDTMDASEPGVAGCGDFAWTHMTAREGIERTGLWDDNFGGQMAITWNRWGDQDIQGYDNGGNWAVTRNAHDAEWSPNLYNLVVWTEPEDDGSWWACTVAYDLESFEAAMEAEDMGDASDPAAGGCGEFAWTRMTPSASSR